MAGHSSARGSDIQPPDSMFRILRRYGMVRYTCELGNRVLMYASVVTHPFYSCCCSWDVFGIFSCFRDLKPSASLGEMYYHGRLNHFRIDIIWWT